MSVGVYLADLSNYTEHVDRLVSCAIADANRGDLSEVLESLQQAQASHSRAATHLRLAIEATQRDLAEARS